MIKKTINIEIQRVKRITWTISFLWLFIMVSSLMWNLYTINNHTKEIAQSEARANFNKDQAIRFWATKHGGVYVPMNERTPANPSLSHIPDRNIVKPNGDTLTLMNPAYMIRQMFDEFPIEYGTVGRIVSLKPLNPNNAPDEWERKALVSFEKGEKECFEYTEINGEEYLRLIQPMITKEGCLKCHALQGYKVGDVRGGVGVSIKMSPLLQASGEQRNALVFFHLLILFVGFVGIWVVYKRNIKKTKEKLEADELLNKSEGKVNSLTLEITKRKQAEELLKTSKDSIENLTNSMLDIIFSVKMPERVIEWTNNSIRSMGYEPSECIGENTVFLYANEDDYLNFSKELQKSIADGINVFKSEIIFKRKDGETFPADVTVTFEKIEDVIVRTTSIIRDITERKLAETQFKRMQELLDDTGSLAKVGGWELDVKTQHLTWTKEVFAIHEVDDDFVPTVEQAINFYTNESKPIIQDALNSAIAHGSTFDVELEVITFKNNKRLVHAIGKAIKHNGEIVSIVGMFQDITQRRKAEEKLRMSEMNLKEASKIALLGNWILNITSSHLQWSEGVFEIFEIDSNKFDATYDAFLNAIHPDDREYVNTTYNESLKNKTPYEITHRLLMPDGRIKWVIEICRSEYDEQGKPIKSFGIVQDITQSKMAEEKLRKNEVIQNKMISNIGDVIVIIDQNGITQYKSSNVKTLFGWNLEDLVGKSTWDNVHPDDLKSAQKFVGEIAMKPDATGTTEIRYKRKDGKYVWIEITLANLLYDPDINGFLGNYHEITERKQAEQELVIAKEKAEESDRLKSAFLANMSHEIRTPMNGILGFAGLLKTPNLAGDDQQKYIGIIEKSGARMLNIINDIVDISKVESGLMELNIEESNINEQIEFIYTFFKTEVEAKGVTLSCINTLSNKEALIKTDREKVFATLTNLVKNAIKYTNDGTIEFGYSKKGKFLEFFVKDTGIGIPKDRQQAIFERFIQADIEDKMARQGAGLGLAITKAYVEMLGGKIWLDSSEGKGSTFYFTIPYNVLVNQEIVTDNIGITDLELPKLKILLVEDDETSEMLLEIHIEEFSNKILKSTTGVEAVETCRQNPDIDLILMDIQLPVMSGYDATRQIRKFNKDVIVIAQTAYGLSGDREKALEAGCNDYISKPIIKHELLALIQKHFK